MKIRIRFLALAMAVVMLVPFAFSACNKTEVTGGAYVENGSAFTKEYFEANKMEVMENSVDVDAVYGIDDSFFDFFKNEKLKNGMQADVEMDIEGVGMNMSVATLAKPLKARIDVAVETPELPMDASLYLDSEKLSLESGLFIGENPVELKFEKYNVIIEKLAGSALGKLLQVPSAEEIKATMDELGINDEYIANVKAALDSYIAELGEGGGFENSFVNKVNGIVEGTLGEVGEAAVKNYEDVEVEAYTIDSTIEKEDIINVINAALDMYVEAMNRSNELTKTIISFDKELVDAYDANGIISEFETVREEFLSAFENMDITGVETLYFGKADGKFIRSDVTVTFTFEGEQVVLTGSEYIVNNGIIIDAEVVYGEEKLFVDGKITNESTDEKYTLIFDFDVTGNAEEFEAVSVDASFGIDKQAKKYEINLGTFAEGEAISVGASGSVESDADSFTFTVDSVYVNDEVTELPENRITLRAIDDIAGHENAKDIFSLDENEIYGIMARISALTGGLE